MIGLGPFPIHAIIAAAAAVVGWLVVRTWARRLTDAAATCPHRAAAGLLFVDVVLIGLLAARLGYVLRWWPEYATAPMSIVAIASSASQARSTPTSPFMTSRS